MVPCESRVSSMVSALQKLKKSSRFSGFEACSGNWPREGDAKASVCDWSAQSTFWSGFSIHSCE